MSDTLPHNIDAEQALLGALFQNDKAFDEVSDILRAEHFYDPLHARIYQSCCDMAKKGQTFKPVLLMSYFQDDEALEMVGGSKYLARVMASAVSVRGAPRVQNVLEHLLMSNALNDPVKGYVPDSVKERSQKNGHDRKLAAEKLSEIYEASQISRVSSVSWQSEAVSSDGTYHAPADFKLDSMTKLGRIKNSTPANLWRIVERAVLEDGVVWNANNRLKVLADIRLGLDHVAFSLGITSGMPSD